MAKSNKKQALGRGLSALLNDPDKKIYSAADTDADKIVGSVIELELNKITVNPFQPRTNFNEETLKELTNSIEELGIIQPITVRKKNQSDFELISGERRYRAAKLIGMKTIPAFVRLANDQELLEMALVENIQRQDLDPIEIALSYQRLLEEIKLTQDQLSERIGKKRSTISNYVRLLKLDPIIQTGIRDGFLTMGHGRSLINIDDTAKQLDLYEKIIRNGLSVRATEKLVQDLKNDSPVKNSRYQPPFVSQATKDLESFFGVSVSLNSNTSGKGSLRIAFNSQEELKQIIGKIRGDA